MRHHLLLALLALLGAPVAAAGQIQIEGQILDHQTLEPLPGVRVEIARVGSRSRSLPPVLSDEHGRFAFTAPESGGYIFTASRIGYEQTETPVLWTDGYQVYEVEIRLDPDAVLLAPIEVIARFKGDQSAVLASFQDRMESGAGHYFTHRDLQRLKPSRVTDILAKVPGVRLRSSGAGLRRVAYMSRGGGRCEAEIFVDGMLWTRPIPGDDGGVFTVDDAVSPASIYGIEIYLGLATVPAEFLTPGARCGVIAIWTRR